MSSWREDVRRSWRGDGWVIWVCTAGTVVAGLAGWLPLALALLVIELVALGSMGSQQRRAHRGR